ncbi:hypothetical protein AMTRI_Chr09g21910 [Amborella trichopoda]
MEGREGMSSGEGGEVAGKFPQAAGIYSQTSGKAPENPSPVISSGAMVSPGMVMKKKRGRPRKYGPGTAMALALTPVSSSPGPMSPLSSGKRGRGRPPGSGNKQRLTGLGEWVTNSAGAGFTPHVITIAAGEDITMKIMSISQQGPRAICILSANGAVSNVTLRQPDSSGGTLTYEGRFEILSLSGSFMLSEFGGTRSRTGGLSVSLASPDGRVIGGGVAGLLLAASPVQIVVGSFLPTEQKNKKPKPPVILGLPQMGSSGEPTAAVPISSAAVGETYGTRTQAAPQPNSTATAPYQGDGWSSLNPVTDSRHSTDINASLQGE